MRYATIFSGVGGWEIGLNACGWNLQWQCENDPFCRAVLAERFGVTIYEDARTLCEQGPAPVDALVGSPPCQPFSIAGRRLGTKDDRDLWPAMLAAVAALRPDWVLCENVSNAANMVLSSWQDDLEAEGYQSIAFDIPTCAVGLSTMERRLWLVASRNVERMERHPEINGEKWACLPEWNHRCVAPFGDRRNLPSPQLLRSSKGFPNFVDRIKSIGNAVPPQIPCLIGQAINEIEGLK